MRRKKSLAVRISGAILLCLLLLLPACAAAQINLGATNTSLTVSFKYEGKAVEGATLTLYRIADLTQDGQISTLSEFADIDIDYENWKSDTAAIETRIAGSRTIKPAAGPTEVVGGEVCWKGLKPGVYFFIGTDGYIGQKYYEPTSGLVSVPQMKDGEWNYHAQASAKPVAKPSELTVYKVWDDGNYASRPKEIIVCLKRNGLHFADRVLNERNKWSYTWKNLSPKYDWTVTEETNLTGKGYQKPTYDRKIESGTDSVKVKITITNYRPTPKDPTLPQTGLDWWPVAIMAVAGMTMFFLGWLRRRQEENDDEDAEA